MKIDNTQLNNKFRLCGERDETVNLISESSKLAQKEYKTRMEKVIYWKLCKKFKFDHTTKWYMHKLESILENEMNKILGDLKTQSDHLILVRKPDLVLIKKKELAI